MAFNKVSDERGQSHCEVTGSMPHLNDLLDEAANSSGPALEALMAAVSTAIQTVVSFCTKLTGQASQG